MLKNKVLLALALLAGAFAACQKSEPYDAEQQLKIDTDSIVKFLAKNNITATRDKSGLYYQIINPGAERNISIDSLDTVKVNYETRLLDGKKVDSTLSSVNLVFGKLIKGWRIGIPLIQPGGKIRLIVPSTLAYTNIEIKGNPPIPVNSVLDYTIDLIQINKEIEKQEEVETP